MEVPDGLSPVTVAVGDEAKSLLGETLLTGDPGGCPEDLSGKVDGSVLHLQDGRNVLPRDDQVVVGSLGGDIFHDHQVVVLVDNGAGTPAVDDGTENTVPWHD